MKKFALVITIVAFTLCACGQKSKSQASEPKNETNEKEGKELVTGDIHAMIEPFSLDEGMEKADLIAEVEIIEKVREVQQENGLPYSVFKARVNRKIAGNKTSDVITIKQEGTSKVSVNNIESFKSGEKFILFLVDAKHTKTDYWVLGASTGLFQVTGNGKIAKLYSPLEELNNIEDKKPDNVNVNQLKTTDLKGVQFINKQMFINKIEKLSKKGE